MAGARGAVGSSRTACNRLLRNAPRIAWSASSFTTGDASARHDDGAAERYQEDVRRLVPGVVAAAEGPPAMDPDDGLVRLRREESQLRSQVSEMERRLAELTRGDE